MAEDHSLERKHLLAAELFSYSYANYSGHLGIGNERFEAIMPNEAELLERAESEGWSDESVAKRLKMELERVPEWRAKFRRAITVVDAPDPVQSFRTGVSLSIRYALDEGLSSPKDVEDLAVQICYRVSDLSVLLDLQGESLSSYSEALREEPNDDTAT